jgi:hypothetical protein
LAEKRYKGVDHPLFKKRRTALLDLEPPGSPRIGGGLIAVRRQAWRLLAFFLIVALPAAGQDSTSQIRTEIQRVQQSLKNRPLTDPDTSNLTGAIEDQLKSASKALKAGRLYLSLEQLGQAVDLLHGALTVEEKKAGIEKDGMPAFEAEWKKVSLALDERERQARASDWSNVRAAIRALSETSQGRAVPLLDGGRGFATATHPKDGLFYLGQAQGEAEFAQFCSTLHFAQKVNVELRRSLLPELQTLQQKTNAAFIPPRSIELHPRFIALNSTLKLAQELDASRSYSGALYQYLEAVRHYGMLSAVPPDGSGQAALKAAIASAQKKLAASEQDDSIAQLFVERAASQVEHASGPAPTADELRSALVIMDHVLPAYFDTRKPGSPLPQASGKMVEITLVRWPYT